MKCKFKKPHVRLILLTAKDGKVGISFCTEDRIYRFIVDKAMTLEDIVIFEGKECDVEWLI